MTSGWAKVQLAEVIAERKEVPSADDLASGKIRIVAKVGFNDGKIQMRANGQTKTGMILVRPGDLVISGINAAKGAIAVYDEENIEPIAATIHYGAYIPNKVRGDVSYLWWLLRSRTFRDLLLQYVPGGIKTELKAKRLLPIPIPLPPLEEQRRIVARTEELAAKIDEARGLRRQAADEFGTLFASEEMRIWPSSSLEGAPLLQEVTTHLARGRQSKQGESDHYLIKTQHVQLGRYLDSYISLAPEVATKVSPDAKVRCGDVLIACSAAGCLGRVAMFVKQGVIASTDTHVAIARADSTKALPEYLYAYLKGAQGQFQLRSRERGDWKREKIGFRLTELNVADLRRIPVPLPPIVEQRRILAHLEELKMKFHALKRLQAETAAELDAMLPSILDKAFKGEL